MDTQITTVTLCWPKVLLSAQFHYLRLPHDEQNMSNVFRKSDRAAAGNAKLQQFPEIVLLKSQQITPQQTNAYTGNGISLQLVNHFKTEAKLIRVRFGFISHFETT